MGDVYPIWLVLGSYLALTLSARSPVYSKNVSVHVLWVFVVLTILVRPLLTEEIVSLVFVFCGLMSACSVASRGVVTPRVLLALLAMGALALDGASLASEIMR